MARYKAGLQTQQAIMNSAKKLFYEMGYTKTSTRMIAAEANVKLGTLTYYYKKEDIVRDLYMDFSIKLYSHITKYAPETNRTLKHIFYSTFLMYHSILSDSNTTAFHLSIVNNEGGKEQIYNELFGKRGQAYLNHLPYHISKEDWEDIFTADNALRQTFLNKYLLEHSKEDSCQKANIHQLCSRILSLTGKLMLIPPETINTYIQDAIAFEKKYDYKTIKLLL